MTYQCLFLITYIYHSHIHLCKKYNFVRKRENKQILYTNKIYCH